MHIKCIHICSCLTCRANDIHLCLCSSLELGASAPAALAIGEPASLPSPDLTASSYEWKKADRARIRASV